MRDDIDVDALVAAERCALLIVDVQNDFCHEAGLVGRSGGDLHLVAGMVDGIARLRVAAAAARVPVVFVVTEHRAETNSPAWLRRSNYAAEMCLPGSFGVDLFIPPPEPGDVVVVKHRYSGFYGTRLESVVRSLGRSTVVVAGTSTDVCVEASVRDALMRDLDAVVAWDATAARDEETRRHSLTTLSRHYATVLSSHEVGRRWSAGGEARDGAGAAAAWGSASVAGADHAPPTHSRSRP